MTGLEWLGVRREESSMSPGCLVAEHVGEDWKLGCASGYVPIHNNISQLTAVDGAGHMTKSC